MELAEKILNETIEKKINFINTTGTRKFDNKCDVVHFTLTPKQFNIIKKHFKLKEIYVLCQGLVISSFEFDNYKFKVNYNDRFNCYNLNGKHKDYIEDFDEQMDYIEEKYL